MSRQVPLAATCAFDVLFSGARLVDGNILYRLVKQSLGSLYTATAGRDYRFSRAVESMTICKIVWNSSGET